LVTAGLATRAASDRDRRVSIVSVSERGREVLAENRVQAARVLDERIGRLSRAERGALAAAAPVLDRLCDDPAAARPTGRDRHVAHPGREVRA
jgi:DNA-binding MarR family transcriptional regulator